MGVASPTEDWSQCTDFWKGFNWVRWLLESFVKDIKALSVVLRKGPCEGSDPLLAELK